MTPWTHDSRLWTHDFLRWAMKTKIISIANQKGGVGKTTTAINIAALLGLSDKKTLLIDLDPQANCTSGIGIKKEEIKKNIYDVFLQGKAAEESIVKTEYENLYIIPSASDLFGLDIEMVNSQNREYLLKHILEDISSEYSYIILDCPPSLNLLTINALSAANSVLIPVQCSYFSLEGLSQLLNVIDLVTTNLNKELEIEGLAMTMYESNDSLAENVIQDVRSHFKDKVFKTVIYKDNTLGEAPGFGKPIVYYKPRSIGAQNYIELTYEMIEKSRESRVESREAKVSTTSTDY